jgi:hypothetical protein
MLVKDTDLAQCLIVEMDADPAADVDFDADQGAMLVIPKEIKRCDQVDRMLMERISTQASF